MFHQLFPNLIVHIKVHGILKNPSSKTIGLDIEEVVKFTIMANLPKLNTKYKIKNLFISYQAF